MKLAILCLCLASTVSAAPPFFHYLPHYGANRQPAPQITAPAVNTAYPGAQPQPQPGVPAPISMEILFPHTFGGAATGGAGPSPSFPSQAIIKYSLPKAPGRKSVEIYYPYDFRGQMMMPGIPSLPQIQNFYPFEYPQNTPQQTPNIPTFDASPPQAQDPLQPAQPAQPTQTNELPVRA